MTPWYRIEADKGPGHPSYSIGYVWRDCRLTGAEMHSLLEGYFSGRDVTGSIVAVKVLPPGVRRQKILWYRRQLEEAAEMLDMLEVK